MKFADDLSPQALGEIVFQIQEALYCTPYEDGKGRPRLKWDRNKVWDAETIELVDGIMVANELSPEDDPA